MVEVQVTCHTRHSLIQIRMEQWQSKALTIHKAFIDTEMGQTGIVEIQVTYHIQGIH